MDSEFSYWCEAIKLQRSDRKQYKALSDLEAKSEAVKARFATWLEDSEVWDGRRLPRLGSKQYDLTRNIMVFARDIMENNPFSPSFCAWVMSNPPALYTQLNPETLAQKEAAIAEKVKSPERIDVALCDLIRADMFEAFGNDLKAAGNSPIFDYAFNNTFVTRGEKREWNALDEDAIVRDIREKGAASPHYIVTANHALYENMEYDLAKIYDGYGKLAQDVFKDAEGKSPFSLKRLHEEGLSSDDTVMLAATNTRENNYLNLASLFRRLYDVAMVNGSPENDRFENISPNALRMSRLVLKLIAQDPSQVSERRHNNMPCLIEENRPFVVRADAPELLRKLNFTGFSKGGNDFRDAMRFLTHQLDKTNALGEPLVTFAQVGMTRHDILGSISVTGESMNELPLGEYYLNKGVSMGYFTNAPDKIAPPPTDVRYDSRGEQKITYGRGRGGYDDYSGHVPAMSIEANALNPVLKNYRRCEFAACAGKAAIRHVFFNNVTEGSVKGKPNALVLKLAPTTSDALFEKNKEDIERALHHEGLDHIHVKTNGTYGCFRYQLESSLGVGALFDVDTIDKLQRAFAGLQKNARDGIEISPEILEYDLPYIRDDVKIAKFRTPKDGDIASNIKVTGKSRYDWMKNLDNAGALNPSPIVVSAQMSGVLEEPLQAIKTV